MRKYCAFTLVELIVSMIILVVLVVFVVPIWQSMKEKTPRMRCADHMHQIAIAFQNYNDVYGSFPPAYVADTDGKPLYSWRVLILPFVEQEMLYKEFHLDEPWDSEHNKKLLERTPWIYRCPEPQQKPGNASYAMIIGPNTISNGLNDVKPKDITDDHSRTIMFAETRKEIPWSAPVDIPFEALEKGITLFDDSKATNDGIGSYHKRSGGGTQVAFVDCSVRYLSPGTRVDTLKALATINGGETIKEEELK